MTEQKSTRYVLGPPLYCVRWRDYPHTHEVEVEREAALSLFAALDRYHYGVMLWRSPGQRWVPEDETAPPGDDTASPAADTPPARPASES